MSSNGVYVYSQLGPTLLRPLALELARLFCPWDSLGKNTGVGSHSLFQGIFPTQRSKLSLLCPALAAGFFTTELPGKLQMVYYPSIYLFLLRQNFPLFLQHFDKCFS